MNSTADDLREMLRESFGRYGRQSYSFEGRQAALKTAQAFSATAWKDYANMGWLALRLPEEAGGLGADSAVTSALMEVAGRHLMLEPLLASVLLGTGALLRAADGLAMELAGGLADGSLILAFAHEGGAGSVSDGLLTAEKVGVLHGDIADHYVVSTADGLVLVDADATGVSRRPYRLVDGRGAAIVVFDRVSSRPLGGRAELQMLLDEQCVALCAENLGCVCHLVDSTAAYLKVRKQFGRPIGSNQALQHRMSEMVLFREEIRALANAAQHALTLPAPQRERMISGATAYTIGAARTVANDAIQLHGGVGVTEELDISHHFRRLMVNAALLGGRDHQVERFARTVFLDADH